VSKIAELILELCPDGVSYTTLESVTKEHAVRNKDGSVLEVRSVTNSAGLVKTNDFFENTRTSADTSNYKVVEPGMIVYNPSRINVGSIARHKEAIRSIVSPMYVVVKIDDTKIDPEYLDLFLTSEQGKNQILSKVEVGARFRLTYKSFARIGLPLPHLGVQREIVALLSKFTDLDKELSAELNARRKQYEYYCNQLLTFAYSRKDVKILTLKELSEDAFWIMPATPRFIANGEVPYITSKNIGGGHIDFTNIKRISRDSYESISKNRPIVKDDILISMIGTIGEVARVKTSDLEFYGQNMYLLRLNQELINVGYFLHFFDSVKMKSYFASIKNNSGQGYLKAGQVESITVPVPPLEEQNRIVSILDKFDELNNSASTGLPAEINARRKQYEHYRTKLLAFQEFTV